LAHEITRQPGESVLGGHKSTVAALETGCGPDRSICGWTRTVWTY